MEVDGEEDDDDGAEGDEDVQMEEGSDAESDAPRPRKKGKGKKKPRKSELDLNALANEAAALGNLNENQHLEQKLRKKYCLDALEFIRQVEEGKQTVQRLLASANKLEQLEAIEFFRVTYEYKFDAAEVCVLVRLRDLVC